MDEVARPFTVRNADALAAAAHAGQTDKIGAPYIEHCRAVAASLQDDDEKIVALLHDVLEDTDVTADDLAAAGVPRPLVRAIQILTRTKNQDPAVYYDEVRRNALARQVKLADVRHNSDPARLAVIDDEETRNRLTAKYAYALEELEESDRFSVAHTPKELEAMSYEELLEVLYKLDYDSYTRFPREGDLQAADEPGSYTELDIEPVELQRLRGELIQQVLESERRWL